MNLCLVITNLTGGGAERALLDLAKAFMQAGNHVEIILFENKVSYKIPSGLHVSIVAKSGFFKNGLIGKKVLQIKFEKLWSKLNKKFNFDMTISRLPYANEIVSKSNRPNSFFIIDNNLRHEIQKIKNKSSFKALRTLYRYKKIYKGKNLIAVSKGIAEDLPSFLNTSSNLVHQIYNPVDIESIISKKKLYKKGTIPRSPFVLHIGRAVQQKRHDLLLDTWATIKAKHKLILITDDVKKIKVMVQERKLDSRVIVLPFQSNPYPWIAKASLLVLCSDFEGLGLVLIESLVCKTPVISTNALFGPQEIFGDRYSNNLIPCGDSPKLAKAITQSLNKKSFAHKVSLEVYSFKTIVAKYEGLCKSKTALFIKTKNIGDSIILTSSINALPEDYIYIDVICLPESYEVFKMSPRVRHIFVIPRNLSGLKKIQAYFELVIQIYRNEYDLLVQFSNDWRGALIARLKKINITVARESSARGNFWHKSFKIVSPIKSKFLPTAEQDVDLLRSAGVFKKNEAPPYSITISQEKIIERDRWLKERKIKRFILIHAISRWKFKEIKKETWAESINSLKEDGYDVILSGSDDDYKENLEIHRLCESKPKILRAKSLEETAAIFNAADLVVSIDSMAIHLASALNKKTIAIFGPTNERNWAPWNVKHRIISLDKEDSFEYQCRPCGNAGCFGTKISKCLTEIKSQLILTEIRKILH
jgi:ADP-heptose:LPS heptosyltransferase